MRKIYGQTGMMNKMCACMCMCMLCAVNLSVRVPLRA